MKARREREKKRSFFDREFINPASNISDSKDGSSRTSEKKREVRSLMLSRRLNLSSLEADELSRQIAANLICHPRFKDAETIALYCSVRNEVSTENIFEIARERGKIVYFPRAADFSLEFLKVNHLDELQPGRFGVPEPHPDSECIGIGDIDLLIIPGVAFDLSGGRLGYGGGYYDRALNRVDLEKRIGLAYDFQVLNRVPAGRGDKRVSLIVTESGVIFCEGE